MVNPQVIEQAESLFARMAANGPILIGGPTHNIQFKDGVVVGISKEPSLPEYLVNAALKHGGVDQRYSTTCFIKKHVSKPTDAMANISDQLAYLKGANEASRKIQVVNDLKQD